jgi:flagellar hook-length control protein FliK
MSNLATVLQVPIATPTLEAAPSLAAPQLPSELAGDQFVLALTQALSAAVPPAAVAQSASLIVPATQPVAASEEASIEALAASFAALLSMPLMAPGTVPTAIDATDPLELLGVSESASRASTQPVLSPALQAIVPNPLFSTPALEEAPSDARVEAGAGQPESNPLVAPNSERPSQAVSAEVAAASRPLQHNVGTRAWAEELGTRVTLLAERGQHTASLRLSPEHLGPLEIRIAIRDDQASVWFGAAHADTRAAIEHALPRLREMFAAQGMSLTDAGVSREPPREQLPMPARQGGAASESAPEPVSAITVVQRIGLIDAYA